MANHHSLAARCMVFLKALPGTKGHVLPKRTFEAEENPRQALPGAGLPSMLLGSRVKELGAGDSSTRGMHSAGESVQGGEQLQQLWPHHSWQSGRGHEEENPGSAAGESFAVTGGPVAPPA